MGIQQVIQLSDQQGAQVVLHALKTYKKQLRDNIEQAKSRLTEFERRYGVGKFHFSDKMTAEDLPGGDLGYVKCAREAKLLEKLEAELKELEHAEYARLTPRLHCTAICQIASVTVVLVYDLNGALIFRYDNAVHRLPLPQPEHKHRPKDIIVSPAPILVRVIDEILEVSNKATRPIKENSVLEL